MDIKKLLKDLEKARADGKLTDSDLQEFNKSGILKIDTEFNNVNNESLNKTGQNYQDTALKSASLKKKIEFDKSDKQTEIEKKANQIKEARSDETRQELLNETNEYKDKQQDRYKQVEDITEHQKRIANRQANIESAKAGQYGDVYSDAGISNIKNDIINRYGQNILNAEQYALNTNRSIDQDLLNVGLTEINDKNKRDEFKNALLDKENSYMLNALEKAAEGDKKAVTDIENFYQNYTRQKANQEQERSNNTERRAGFEKEFSSLDKTGKSNMLRDMSFNLPGYNLVADRIPDLIDKYPNLSLGELKGKMAKIGNFALTGAQKLDTIIAKPENDRTQDEKDLLLLMLGRGKDEIIRSDRDYSYTLDQAEKSQNGGGVSGNIDDDNLQGKEVLGKYSSNKRDGIRDKYDRNVLNSSNESNAIKDNELDSAFRIDNTNGDLYNTNSNLYNNNDGLYNKNASYQERKQKALQDAEIYKKELIEKNKNGKLNTSLDEAIKIIKKFLIQKYNLNTKI